MPTGSCFCKEVRVSWTGEPKAHTLCHCLDCRKLSGGSHSNNYIIPADNFKLEAGTPKTISKIGESGKKVIYNFCPDCGVTVWGTGDAFPGVVILKIGAMDDLEWSGKNVPKVEIFTKSRLDWVSPIEGAVQKETV